jgi:hypothetical protein
LSDTGWRLVLPVLGAVARFGLQTTPFNGRSSRSPLSGFLVGVLLGFRPAGAATVAATYRAQIDGRSFDFAIADGQLGAARREPDVVLTASASDLVAARLGGTAAQRLAALRRLRFAGEHDDVETMQKVLGLTSDTAKATVG